MNDLLCFLQNKVHYVPVDTLVEVVVGGFDAGQIEKAKEQLFEAVTTCSQLNHVRNKKHKSSGGKSKEIRVVSDMVALLQEADRLGCSPNICSCLAQQVTSHSYGGSGYWGVGLQRSE